MTNVDPIMQDALPTPIADSMRRYHTGLIDLITMLMNDLIDVARMDARPTRVKEAADRFDAAVAKLAALSREL